MFFHFRLSFLRRFALVAMIFAAAQSLSVSAATDDVPVSSALPAELVWHAGAIGIFDQESHDVFASLEGRWRRDWHGVRPWGGYTVTDAGAWFAGAGLIYDIRIAPRAVLTLGSGPFYYTHDKRDDDLGFRLEFYSFIETSWVGKNDLRVGVRLGHLSNAGLGRRNPGTETLSLVVALPFERLLAAHRNP